MEARQQPDNSFGGHFASWIVCIPLILSTPQRTVNVPAKRNCGDLLSISYAHLRWARIHTRYVAPALARRHNVSMNATRSFFSWGVSFVPRIKLKNSTVSSTVIKRSSWK